MSEKKHWTAFLPEVGQIEKLGREQIIRHLELGRLYAECEMKRREMKEAEAEICKIAAIHWTLEEIQTAFDNVDAIKDLFTYQE